MHDRRAAARTAVQRPSLDQHRDLLQPRPSRSTPLCSHERSPVVASTCTRRCSKACSPRPSARGKRVEHADRAGFKLVGLRSARARRASSRARMGAGRTTGSRCRGSSSTPPRWTPSNPASALRGRATRPSASARCRTRMPVLHGLYGPMRDAICTVPADDWVVWARIWDPGAAGAVAGRALRDPELETRRQRRRGPPACAWSATSMDREGRKPSDSAAPRVPASTPTRCGPRPPARLPSRPSSRSPAGDRVAPRRHRRARPRPCRRRPGRWPGSSSRLESWPRVAIVSAGFRGSERLVSTPSRSAASVAHGCAAPRRHRARGRGHGRDPRMLRSIAMLCFPPVADIPKHI